jgi:hypothetical protein
MGVQIKFLVHLKKTLKEHMLGKEYAATWPTPKYLFV